MAFGDILQGIIGGIGGLLNVGSNIPVAGKYVKKIKGEVDDTLGGIGNTMNAATPYSQEAQAATENAATQAAGGQNNATSSTPIAAVAKPLETAPNVATNAKKQIQDAAEIAAMLKK